MTVESAATPVHPRSCGDRFKGSCDTARLHGSSPLVRGSAPLAWAGIEPGRFIPARAGIGLMSSTKPKENSVHPRSCGDRSSTTARRLKNRGSSPLVRGSVNVYLCGSEPIRFIPARAGIGAAMPYALPEPPVHPRSCGDRMVAPGTARPVIGSSPLVRGSGIQRIINHRADRFIPARAGIGS